MSDRDMEIQGDRLTIRLGDPSPSADALLQEAATPVFGAGVPKL